MPMTDGMTEAMTGMSSGKRRAPKSVRRGGGRHKGASGVIKAPHEQHAADVQTAMANGDHAAAKASALRLANALHKLTAKATQAAQAAQDTPDADDIG